MMRVHLRDRRGHQRAWGFCVLGALFIAGVVLVMMARPAAAVEPDELLKDPALEARARAISANVRCVVCQNEPIDSSNAGMARDLRLLIRERLLVGDSDPQIYDYLVQRYGDFVLFKPPLKPETYALWFGPFVFLAIGALAVGWSLWRRRGHRDAIPGTVFGGVANTDADGAQPVDGELSQEEEHRLARILQQEDAR